MAVRFVAGDLFVESELVSLGHGCNCAGAMGKSIAVPFKKQNPEMYIAYKDACRDGTLRVGGVFPWRRQNGTSRKTGKPAPWLISRNTSEVRPTNPFEMTAPREIIRTIGQPCF